MSLGEWVSAITICAGVAAIGIALAWVVGRSEMASRSSILRFESYQAALSSL